MEKAKIFKYKTEKLIANVFVMIFSITCIYPIIWMLYSSVKSNQEFNRNILSLPKEIHLENFVEAWLGYYRLWTREMERSWICADHTSQWKPEKPGKV